MLGFIFLTSKEKMEYIMEILVKKNPIMKEVYDEYNKFVNTKDLFDNYAEYEKNYFDILALNEERIKGREEGIKETQISMAKNMKNKNMDLNIISELTNLSIEEIKKL